MFTKYPSAQFIKGIVPDCLDRVTPDLVAFVYSDLNIAKPEIAALDHLWPRLSHGAIWMIDDYGMFPETHKNYDEWAKNKGLGILSTGIGPGIMIKP
jgi:hypothetical protein